MHNTLNLVTLGISTADCQNNLQRLLQMKLYTWEEWKVFKDLVTKAMFRETVAELLGRKKHIHFSSDE